MNEPEYYTCTIVVAVYPSDWSEQNDRDLDCMRQAVIDLENVDGADEVPWYECRPSTPREIIAWKDHQQMLENKIE